MHSLIIGNYRALLYIQIFTSVIPKKNHKNTFSVLQFHSIN